MWLFKQLFTFFQAHCSIGHQGLSILELSIIYTSLDVYSSLIFYFPKILDKLNREDCAGSRPKTLILLSWWEQKFEWKFVLRSNKIIWERNNIKVIMWSISYWSLINFNLEVLVQNKSKKSLNKLKTWMTILRLRR